MNNRTVITLILIFTFIVFLFRKKINKATMFDMFMNIVFRHEGGYVNDPDDLGGETKYGITKRRYPNLDIKNLTKDEAKELYRKDFYIPMKIEEFTNMNLALHYFDMGINAGIKNATNLLTEAYKIKNEHPERSIVGIYKDLRIAYYTKVAEYRNNKKFLKGWLNRVETTKLA